ncbi:hypothetical protein [Amycolatopsis magusensis]|uniref:hypothetical protein n=1 Tax=Amycolatopsis magusensis TaxID=882444 RepID=UPI0024A85E46|nr:hypothetical protein [Amycolatopsis magusensis]MDI5975272.1 hypothetical protein [Amycolatopsis magusensis]
MWLVPDDLVHRGAAIDLLGVLEARDDTVRVPAPEVRVGFQEFRPTVELAGGIGALPDWARSSLGVLDPDEPVEPEGPAPTTKNATSVAERLLQVVGEATSVDHADEPLALLAASNWLRGKVVVICAWDENDPEDIASVVTRLTAHSKERGLTPAERPRVLVAARLGDLPGWLLEQVDSITTKVHWWWGACGRLDTAVVASRFQRGRTRAPRTEFIRGLIAFEVLVEVAGPDLLLADCLASSWDGRMATLGEQIDAFKHTDTDVLLPQRHALRSGGDRPAAELRPAWMAGMVDLWDGQVRMSPALQGKPGQGEEITALVWRGQNRALTPLIDGCRAQLEKQIRARANHTVIAELLREHRVNGQGRERSTL